MVEDGSVVEYDINQDSKLLELFKNDAFSVEVEILRRNEEGVTANLNICQGRPIMMRILVKEVPPGEGKCQRVQDRELLEMSDDGLCLGIHQPWASLLVMGVKIY